MKKRAIGIFMGLLFSVLFAVALTGIFWIRESEKTENPETISKAETEKTEAPEPKAEETDSSCTFLSLGKIYYLLPEEEAGFQKQVMDFLKENAMEADTVTVLGKVEDDTASMNGTARFYLQLDDAGRTVLQAIYKKETGEFLIKPCQEGIENIEDYGGMELEKKEEGSKEPEYSEEGSEFLELGRPQITDPDGQLSETVEMEILKNNLLLFLKENQEERRLFFVSSFEKTRTGYEAVLEFETSRIDGKNVEVDYVDGKYEFGWR